MDTSSRDAFPSIVKETLRRPRNDPSGETESRGLSEQRSDQGRLMVSSEQPTQPLGNFRANGASHRYSQEVLRRQT